MSRPGILTFAVGVIFAMTLVSSVRADSVHTPKALQKLNLGGEFQSLALSDFSKIEFRDFLAAQFDADDSGRFVEQFEGNNGWHLGLLKNRFGVASNDGSFVESTGNNGPAGASAGNHVNSGKHLGFSVTQFNNGQKFGLANPRSASPQVSQNPEPTAMLLLGTGLAGVAALARRKSRRRKS
jgi:hypothetical protein